MSEASNTETGTVIAEAYTTLTTEEIVASLQSQRESLQRLEADALDSAAKSTAQAREAKAVLADVERKLRALGALERKRRGPRKPVVEAE